MNIAVLGGTFAPPTVAHVALLRAGMDFTGAECGVWVPSSVSYMKKWRPESIPEAWFIDGVHRAGMISAICAAEGDMRLYAREMAAENNAYTFDTLCALEQEYGGKVAFIMGADLLRSLDDWYRADELIERFRVVVAARNGEKLSARRGIEIMPFPDAYRDISATQVRALIADRKPDEARAFLHPAVFEYICKHRTVPARA